MRKTQCGVPVELWKSDSNSWALQTAEQVLGSLGCTEARDGRFSHIPYATVCHRNAENKVETLGQTLAQGQREGTGRALTGYQGQRKKGREESSGRVTAGRRERLASSGGLL